MWPSVCAARSGAEASLAGARPARSLVGRWLGGDARQQLFEAGEGEARRPRPDRRRGCRRRCWRLCHWRRRRIVAGRRCLAVAAGRRCPAVAAARPAVAPAGCALQRARRLRGAGGVLVQPGHPAPLVVIPQRLGAGAPALLEERGRLELAAQLAPGGVSGGGRGWGRQGSAAAAAAAAAAVQSACGDYPPARQAAPACTYHCTSCPSMTSTFGWLCSWQMEYFCKRETGPAGRRASESAARTSHRCRCRFAACVRQAEAHLVVSLQAGQVRVAHLAPRYRWRGEGGNASQTSAVQVTGLRCYFGS